MIVPSNFPYTADGPDPRSLAKALFAVAAGPASGLGIRALVQVINCRARFLPTA
jgi:hypothetical protein